MRGYPRRGRGAGLGAESARQGSVPASPPPPRTHAPVVMAASAGVSTSGARGRPRRCKCTPKICSRPTRSGLSTETRRSKRPGRSSAGSNTSALQEREEGRSGGGKGSRQGGKRKLRIGPARGGGSLPHLFVAAMQVTTPAPSAPLSKPSSSVSSWFRVCSRSSLPTLRRRVSRPCRKRGGGMTSLATWQEGGRMGGKQA